MIGVTPLMYVFTSECVSSLMFGWVKGYHICYRKWMEEYLFIMREISETLKNLKHFKNNFKYWSCNKDLFSCIDNRKEHTPQEFFYYASANMFHLTCPHMLLSWDKTCSIITNKITVADLWSKMHASNVPMKYHLASATQTMIYIPNEKLWKLKTWTISEYFVACYIFPSQVQSKKKVWQLHCIFVRMPRERNGGVMPLQPGHSLHLGMWCLV